MTARKLEQQRFRQLGLQAAQELQRLHGDLFESYPIRSSRVARRLGIRVVRSDIAAERGRIYLGTGIERGHSHSVIYLSSAQRLEDARFDLAHEIGHAVLHLSPHEIGGRLPVDSHEAFANAFASSLLVPSKCESEIVRRLTLCTTPDDMLALAGSFGISVPKLFSAISLRPHWMQGIDSVWLRIRLMPHPYGRGRNAKKLRIDHLLFDYSRTFMPRYQGIASCMIPSDWFDSLSVGANSSARVVTLRHWSRNAAGDRTRFSRAETTMKATVKRLAAFRGAFTEMFLLSLVPV